MKRWLIGLLAAGLLVGAAAAPEQARLYGARRLSLDGMAVTEMQDGGSAVAGWQSVERLGMLVIRFDAAGAPAWQRIVELPGLHVVARHVSEVGDGGIVMMGEMGGGTAGNMPDLLLVRFDAAGTLQWTRRFRAPGGGSLFPLDLTVAADGSIYVLASGSGFGSGPSPAWLARVAPDGTPQWQRLLTLDASSAQTTADGGVVVSGTSACGSGSDCAAWLVQLAADAALQRETQVRFDGLYTFGRAARPAPGGGWYVAGGTVPGPGRNDGWLLHVDADFAPIWARRWDGSGCSGTTAAFEARIAGAGIVMTAGCAGGNAIVAGLDAQGLLRWQSVPDYRDLEPVMHVWRVAPTPEGGFFGVGSVGDVNLPPRLLHLRSDGEGKIPRCRAIDGGPARLTDGGAPALEFRTAAVSLSDATVAVDAPIPTVRAPRLQPANACRL
jgi:hypothetical protein